MDWSKSVTPSNAEGVAPQGDQLPPLPDESLDRGVLPRVIKTLVDRRRAVKRLVKTEKDQTKKEEVSASMKVFNYLHIMISFTYIIHCYPLFNSSIFVNWLSSSLRTQCMGAWVSRIPASMRSQLLPLSLQWAVKLFSEQLT
jgi:hypothetical protein